MCKVELSIQLEMHAFAAAGIPIEDVWAIATFVRVRVRS
jgi:hypothetical protein